MPQGEYLQYGGQAIVEGVMMRSPHHFAVAVRAPNDEIVLQTEPLQKTWIGRIPFFKWPFLRGSFALIDAMSLGSKALKFASNVQIDPAFQPKVEVDEAEAETDASSADTVSSGSTESINSIAVGASMVVGLGVGLFLFMFLPNLVGEQLREGGKAMGFLHSHGVPWKGVRSETALNFISGLLKFVIFLGYLWLISRTETIRRVFQYHGAEHKAINTLEAEQDLTLENCKRQTRLHPRCGTSFAIVVLIIDVIIFTFVPRYPLGHEASIFLNLLTRFGINLAVIPFIAGIAYEGIRLAGKFRSTRIVNTVFWPGLMTQYLTTKEPDDSQIEVALAALKACVKAEAPAPEVDPAEALT